MPFAFSFPHPKTPITARRPAYALATILILMAVALFGAGAIVTISTLESKISRSQQEGVRAYYVAEAGVQAALWTLNNNPTYSTELINGTLNQNINPPDQPAASETFDAHLYTDVAKGAGYAIIDVVGTYNNGYFTAKRQIQAHVFQGIIASPTATNAIFAGGSLQVTNGSANVVVSGGDAYASNFITANNTHINLGTGAFNSPGSLTINPPGSPDVIYGALHTANYPPAASSIAPPGFDFTYYQTHYSVKYTPTQFQNLISAAGATKTLPGPITYVDGSVNIGNWGRNKTLNITGMLIFNGSLSINGSATGLAFNVNDPGDGKAGVFTRTGLSMSNGTWNVNGVVYSSGDITVTNTNGMNINGGLVAGGTVKLNTGTPLNVTYNSTRLGSSFGSGSPLNVQVQHWEEEY